MENYSNTKTILLNVEKLQINNKRYIWIEYLGVIALWLLIFGKNAFSNLLFVDYVPATSGVLWRNLIVSNFATSISAISILREVFGFFNLQSIFFSSTILISILVSYYYISKITEGNNRFLFALIFFFNPFIYSRIMIGQLGITMAYLLMPLFLFYLFEMFNKEFEYKSIAKVVLAMTLIGAMTPHFFIINFIMFIIGSFWFYFYRNNFNLKKYLKVLGIFVLLLLLMNLYWIQGMFAGGILEEIDESHESFFAPKTSEGIPAITKVIGMYGFWRESAYDRSYDLMPIWIWYLIIFSLVLIMIIGYYSSKDNKRSNFFYTLFWIGLILGVGVSHQYTGRIFEQLFENLPFFNGFRDSHKFVSFIALAYAYFLPQAVNSINRLNNQNKKILKILMITGLIALILGLNFTMINLNGQVRNTEYPSDYFEANEFLNNQEINGKMIYLPWEGYLTYSWSRNVSYDGRIGVFLNGIIEKGVATGPDRYGGNQGFRLDISECLDKKDSDCLKEKGVEYLIHDSCAIYPENYTWLKDKQSVFQNECLEIYNLGGKSEDTKVPLRFLVSLLLSITTLGYLLSVLVNRKHHRVPQEPQTHKLQTI